MMGKELQKLIVDRNMIIDITEELSIRLERKQPQGYLEYLLCDILRGKYSVDFFDKESRHHLWCGCEQCGGAG